MKRTPAPLRSTAGWTLVETLVALGIFSLVVTAVTPLLITTIAGNAHARHVTEATTLARDKLEELRGAGATSLVSGSDPAPLNAAVQTGGATAMYSRSWAVAAGPAPKTKRVSVTVNWTDRIPRRVTLDTLMAK